MHSNSRTNAGLGVAPLVVVGAIQQIGNSWKSISGIFGGHPKDGERFAKNAEAYRAAVAGNQTALEFLKYRSGRFGIWKSQTYGDVGGWATQAAQSDAWKLYEAALAAWGVTPDETGGDGNVPSPGGNDYTGQPLPANVTTAGINYGPLVLGGLVIAALVGVNRRNVR